MAKVVNKSFLNLVHTHYWKLIESGDLRPGSPESEILFTSIRVSLSPYRVDLVDYKFIRQHIKYADRQHADLVSPEECNLNVDEKLDDLGTRVSAEVEATASHDFDPKNWEAELP